MDTVFLPSSYPRNIKCKYLKINNAMWFFYSSVFHLTIFCFSSFFWRFQHLTHLYLFPYPKPSSYYLARQNRKIKLRAVFYIDISKGCWTTRPQWSRTGKIKMCPSKRKTAKYFKPYLTIPRKLWITFWKVFFELFNLFLQFAVFLV